MLRKILLIDDVVIEDADVQNALSLLPSIKNMPSYRIDIDEIQQIEGMVTGIIKQTTDVIVNASYYEKLPYKKDAIRAVVRANISIITYALIDRLIRISRFFKQYKHREIILPHIFDFKPPKNYTELYGRLRDSWEYNQYIINGLLKYLESEKISNLDKDSKSHGWDYATWDYDSGYGSDNKNLNQYLNKIRAYISTYHNMTASYFTTKLFRRFLKLLGMRGGDWALCNLAHSSYDIARSWLIWPFGPFGYAYIDYNMPDLWVGECISELRTNLVNEIKHNVEKIYYDTMSELGEPLDNRILSNIPPLIINMLPINCFEEIEIGCKWALKNLGHYRGKKLFNYGTSGTDSNIFYTFAARQLGCEVWTIQHSARGGYLANAPLVSEICIAECNKYVTSGWTNKEKHLEMWRDKAVPLCSPHYSRLSNKPKFKQVQNETVLLCTGETYRFPVLYDGSYYIDTMSLWSEIIRDIVKNLTDSGVKVILKLYNQYPAKHMEKAVEEWMNVGGDKLILSTNVEKGSAGSMFDLASVVIWDIPAGGFSEALLGEKPTISIWNDNLMRAQEEAVEYINALKKVGILNKNGNEMTKSVLECINNLDWLIDPNRRIAIDNFLNRFISVSTNWRKEWSHYFRNYCS